jgi:hypothetical protein
VGKALEHYRAAAVCKSGYLGVYTLRDVLQERPAGCFALTAENFGFAFVEPSRRRYHLALCASAVLIAEYFHANQRPVRIPAGDGVTSEGQRLLKRLAFDHPRAAEYFLRGEVWEWRAKQLERLFTRAAPLATGHQKEPG